MRGKNEDMPSLRSAAGSIVLDFRLEVVAASREEITRGDVVGEDASRGDFDLFRCCKLAGVAGFQVWCFAGDRGGSDELATIDAPGLALVDALAAVGGLETASRGLLDERLRGDEPRGDSVLGEYGSVKPTGGFVSTEEYPETVIDAA
jgi:hypothetical protein